MTTRTRIRSTPLLRLSGAAAALALLLAACAGGSDDAASADEAAAEVSAAVDDLASATSGEEMSEAVEDMAESLEAQQSGGSATITVGGETWAFDGALCAFPGGGEFNLSAIANGLQFYLSIDEFGHSASIHDIENFDDPSVSYDSATDAGEFIRVDGKDISGEVGFVDFETDSLDTLPGAFEATCP